MVDQRSHTMGTSMVEIEDSKTIMRIIRDVDDMGIWGVEKGREPVPLGVGARYPCGTCEIPAPPHDCSSISEENSEGLENLEVELRC